MDCIKCKATLPDGAVFCHICGKKQTPETRKHRKRANGSGTIFKLPGKRARPWVAQRNRVYLGTFKTYAEAQKALELTTDTEVNSKYNLTFAQVYEQWRPVHAREVSTSQMACYATAFKQSATLHERKFRTLRKSDFMSVLLPMEEAGMSKSSCEKLKQLFGQLSKWAMDEGIVNQNHAKNVRTTAEQKSIKKAFTEDQIRAIQQATSRARPIALILIATGARTIELFNVPLADCYEDYIIAGSKAKKGQPVKRRVIPVSDIGKDAYQDLLQAAKASGKPRLIDGYNGNRDSVNFQKRDFTELMVEIGATDMTPYSCRHTFSTLAVKAGITPAMLARMMGHEDIKTTDKHYTHLDAEDILQEISKIKQPA
jgi:site-specific recombinase XerD